MSMIIANNHNAIQAQRQLGLNNKSMTRSLEALSSGYKINKGSDDPSGLVISEQLRAQNAGLQRAVRNTQEANNVLGIAEGALNEMSNILKKMKQLAIHAASSGVTSPEQVGADQAEIDSSIQTLDRIARTTKYSDQFLLNGNKELHFTALTSVNDTSNMSLIDTDLSNISQIFRKEDYSVRIAFAGGDASTDPSIDERSGNQAQKGYFEVSKTNNNATQIYEANADTVTNGSAYSLTHYQEFTVRGSGGSRFLSFGEGAKLGDVVGGINSVSASTGVEANLIFDATVTAEAAASGTADWDTAASGALAVARGSGEMMIYVRDEYGDIVVNEEAGYSMGTVSDISGGVSTGIIGAHSFGTDSVQVGKNTDGDGRIYLKMVDDNNYILYKDEAMTMAVGYGSDGVTMGEMNNSGLTDFMIDTTNLKAGYSAVIQADQVMENSGASWSASEGINFSHMSQQLDTSFSAGGSAISGIRLGENTDENGKLHVKIVADNTNTFGSSSVQVFVYRSEAMNDEDLVAQSAEVDLGAMSSGTADYYRAVDVQAVLADNGENSGLFATFNLSAGIYTNGDNTSILSTADGETGKVITATISAENLGLRVSAADYGADEYVSIDMHQGALFTRYSDTDGPELLDAGLTGKEWISYGQDAMVSLNGQELTLDGISGTLANLDITADLTFNEGDIGATTIAAVGYDEGALASRAGAFADYSNDLVHAVNSTTEVLGDWTGGMVLQLGEGSGDQSRTVFSLEDMTVNNLGKVEFSDVWGNDNFVTDKRLSINDLFSGGEADLSNDPVKAMQIIEQAINDVANARAEIGAFQANMLDTNANNLNVAIEKITQTESYIRDADMAHESTLFSRNQIMAQASTSMLAQANQLPQSALSLIG